MSISPSLHDPAPRPPPPSTTVNGAAARPPGAEQPTLQSEVHSLTQAKEDIEAQLEVYIAVLKTNNCTMTTALIDPQGFPRSDIDVAGVRTARVQIIRLRNDLEGVRGEMGRLVERGLPRGDRLAEGEEEHRREEGEGETAREREVPFAKVDGVFPGSPADVAGLLRSDLLLTLSHLNSTNHHHLRAVGQLVSQSEGVVLPLTILRTPEGGEEQRLSLRLTPRTGWGGRGLLGCHIVPV